MSVVDFKRDKRIAPKDRVILREFCSLLGGDPAVLAGRLGVKVYETQLDQGVDGYIAFDPDCGSASGYKVILNLRSALARKKFTLAHELGHFVLHRHNAAFRQAKTRSADVFELAAAYRSTDPWDQIATLAWMEPEADQFAAAILLPMGALKAAPEFQANAPAALAQKLNLSDAFVARRFREAS